MDHEEPIEENECAMLSLRALPTTLLTFVCPD